MKHTFAVEVDPEADYRARLEQARIAASALFDLITGANERRVDLLTKAVRGDDQRPDEEIEAELKSLRLCP